MESTWSACSFFVKKLGESFLKENLEHLGYLFILFIILFIYY